VSTLHAGALDSPASLQAATGRDVLDGCLLELRVGPISAGELVGRDAVDRARLELGRLELSDLRDPDHLGLLERVTAAMRHAAQAVALAPASAAGARLRGVLLDLGDKLDAARPVTLEAIVAAQARDTSTSARQLPAKRRPFQASVGMPAFHAVARDQPMLATVDLGPEDDISPDPDDDLDRIHARMLALAHRARAGGPVAEAPEPPAAAPRARTDAPGTDAAPKLPAPDDGDERALGALAQLRRQLGRCMDEIGILGNLRRVEGSARWHERLPDFEQRLLNHLDALVALGERRSSSPPFDLLAEAMAYADDRAATDFTRAFARALLLGSVEGDDTARAAVLTLAQAPAATRAAQADALSLGSNPSLAGAALRLVSLPHPAHRQLGLELMAARRGPGLESVVGLLEDPNAAVRKAALHYVAVAAPREIARDHLDAAIRREDDDAVLLEALRGAFSCDPSLALAKLRMRLREGLEDPVSIAPGARRELVWMLGIAGGRQDGELLAKVAGQDAVEIAALGWHGDIEHVARLVHELERSGETAADRASSDGTGDAIADADAVPFLDRDPSPTRLAAALALCRITGASLPAFEDDPDAYRPSTDPDRWRAWLSEHVSSLPTSSRLRFGQPFALRASLEELEAVGVPNDLREALAFELGIALGQPPLDVHGWVARQRAELGAVRAMLEAGPSATATATSPTLRRALLTTGSWLGDLFGVT
jgi:hypothetical protein